MKIPLLSNLLASMMFVAFTPARQESVRIFGITINALDVASQRKFLGIPHLY
jgi:hypothetical protein